MKLSICMMVRDEEKYLEKCLIHLKKLMNFVDSELIIVDTGSKDKTIEIAKKYTDKVYFHKWNNNFSEMRNITISYANGEWILIIDADEMLVKYEDIVNFFNSEHIKNYNTVFLGVKNLTESEDRSTYSILSSPRIFKNDGYFKYEGAVHNSPVFREPCAYIDALLEHYGYIFNDKNFAEKKFQRTATILKKELEKNPNNIYYWYQLSVSYSMHNDQQEAINSAVKSFKLMYEKINRDQFKEYIYVYTQLALCYLKIKDFNMVEYVCSKAEKDGIEHIDIYYLLGKSQMINNKNYESINSYEKYLIALDNYMFKENAKLQTYYHGKKEFVFFDLFILNKSIGQYEKAMGYCEKIQDTFIITNVEFVEENINLYLDTNNYNGLENFYCNTIIKYNLEESFILYIENYMSNKMVNISRIKEIFKVKNSYTDLLEFRLNIMNNNYKFNENNEVYDMLKTNFNELYYFYGDILYYYIKKSVSEFMFLLKNIREEKIMEFFKYIDGKHDDFIELLFNSLYFDKESFNNVNLKKIISKYLVIVLDSKNVSYKKIFKMYIEFGIKHLESIYNIELLENEKIYLLEDEEKAFFVYMRKANLLKSSNKKRYLYYLKNSLTVYPYMNNGVKLLLDEFKENEKKYEMEMYKKQIIETIKTLIKENKFEEVKEIINEYEKIIFGDPEIEDIKLMLQRRA